MKLYFIGIFKPKIALEKWPQLAKQARKLSYFAHADGLTGPVSTGDSKTRVTGSRKAFHGFEWDRIPNDPNEAFFKFFDEARSDERIWRRLQSSSNRLNKFANQKNRDATVNADVLLTLSKTGFLTIVSRCLLEYKAQPPKTPDHQLFQSWLNESIYNQEADTLKKDILYNLKDIDIEATPQIDEPPLHMTHIIALSNMPAEVITSTLAVSHERDEGNATNLVTALFPDWPGADETKPTAYAHPGWQFSTLSAGDIRRPMSAIPQILAVDQLYAWVHRATRQLKTLHESFQDSRLKQAPSQRSLLRELTARTKLSSSYCDDYRAALKPFQVKIFDHLWSYWGMDRDLSKLTKELEFSTRDTRERDEERAALIEIRQAAIINFIAVTQLVALLMQGWEFIYGCRTADRTETSMHRPTIVAAGLIICIILFWRFAKPNRNSQDGQERPSALKGSKTIA